MNAVFPLIQSTAGFSAQLFNPCNARWPFHFPLLLQFSSSLSSFGLITSTWSCKWKMLPVSCSIHSHLALHCLRQGALPVFPVSLGGEAPDLGAGLLPVVTQVPKKMWVTFQQRTPPCACAPSPCSLSHADPPVRHAVPQGRGTHSLTHRDPTRLESHQGETAVAPERRLTPSFHCKSKLTLSWPCLLKSTNL